MKNITQFFKQDLGAPLNNQQWSWGALDERGRVFLRVWQNDWEQKARRCLAIAPEWSNSLGFNEREKHLSLIEGGSPGYLIVCNGEVNASTGKVFIKEYREDKVFPIASIERAGDNAFARWSDPVTVASLQGM